MPMLRAVPAMMFMACSTELALRSFIFSSAMLRSDVAADGNPDGLAGVALALLNAGGPAQQVGRRRSAGDEGEGTVLVHGEVHGNDGAGLAAGALVVFLDEGHDVDAVLTQGRADGRRGRGLARFQLQLDDCHYFLSH